MIQNNSEFKGYTTPKRVWDIFVNTLTKPKQTFENTRFQWRESLVYLLVFLVLSVADDQILNLIFNDGAYAKEVMLSSIFTGFYIWVLLSLIFQIVSFVFKGRENMFTILGSMGYAVIPLIPLALLELILSLLVWQGLIPAGSLFAEFFPRVLSWIGLAWAWPGLLCFFMLENIYKFGYKKAGYVMAITWLIVIVAWFLPSA